MINDHLTGEQMEKIEDALNAENKIGAIQLFREYTGMGLKESKEAVEDHIKRLIERDPEKYGHLLSAGSTGCFGILGVILSSASVAAFLLS